MQPSISLSDTEVLQMAEKIVGHYIRKSLIPLREKEDVQMCMVEKFLLKRNQILCSFKGKSNVHTYFYAVLNRMCLEIIRKESKYWYGMQEEADGNVSEKSGSSLNRVIIEDEMHLFEKILRMFGDEMAKIVLFLKFMYEIRIQEEDIHNYTRGYDGEEIHKLLDIQGEKLTEMKKFKIMQQIVNLQESKSISPDAVRMWYSKIISHILNRLNGSLQRSSYNKESLGLLLDFMYDTDGEYNAAFSNSQRFRESIKYA